MRVQGPCFPQLGPRDLKDSLATAREGRRGGWVTSRGSLVAAQAAARLLWQRHRIPVAETQDPFNRWKKATGCPAHLIAFQK